MDSKKYTKKEIPSKALSRTTTQGREEIKKAVF